MANRNFPNSRIYTGHVFPVLLDCNFIVDSANGNGLGIRSLKGPFVKSVYMHTSATPAAGNPNPAVGTIVVQLQDNYNRLFTGGYSVVSPVSGSALKVDNSALTAGVAYIITALDATNTSAAAWHTLGVPAGVTPAVGVSFIAANSGTSGNVSSARVMATATNGSGIAQIETVGDSNQSIAPSPSANQGFGSQIIMQCRNYSNAVAAPADGTVISLSFLLSNSSITVAGE